MTEAWPRRPPLEAASLREVLAALTTARDGDFSVRLPGSADPLLDDIAAAFNSLAARLSERAAARRRFFPTLSHELRTPLNSMLVLARLLANNPDGNLTAEQVEYARVIHSAGADLLGVISDLLDSGGNAANPSQSAPPEAGQRLLVVEAARRGVLTLLARGAVSGLPGAARPGSSFPGSAAPASAGQPPAGPAEVLTAATAEEVADALGAGPPHCVVLDLGADGKLASAALELLRSRPGTRRVPVLAYARDDLAAARFADLRGQPGELLRSPGELRDRIARQLSPADREGPAREAAPCAEGAGPARRGHAGLRGKKILVVDDDPRNVFAITSTLEHHGMTVLRSADGQASIEALRSAPDTDLVLMDLMMPGMDGYAAISAIRDMPEFSGLPIIAVTAHTMSGELARGVPGADDCLTKPLDTDELLGRMARCLAS